MKARALHHVRWGTTDHPAFFYFKGDAMNQHPPRTKPASELDDNRLETVRGDSHDPGEDDQNDLTVEALADADSGDGLRPPG